MSWQNEIVLMVRHLIDDVDSTLYTDSRLEDAILVSALLMKFEVDFDQTYTVDVDGCSISPDPTSSPRDDAFVTLVALKTSCVLLNGEAKIKAASSVQVTDGPSTINMTGVAKAIADRAKKYCEDYDRALLQYQLGNSRSAQAVLTPYTQMNVQPIRGNF